MELNFNLNFVGERHLLETNQATAITGFANQQWHVLHRIILVMGVIHLKGNQSHRKSGVKLHLLTREIHVVLLNNLDIIIILDFWINEQHKNNLKCPDCRKTTISPEI